MFAGVPVGILEDVIALHGVGRPDRVTLCSVYGDDFNCNPDDDADENGEVNVYDEQIQHETPETILAKTNELIDELKGAEV